MSRGTLLAPSNHESKMYRDRRPMTKAPTLLVMFILATLGGGCASGLRPIDTLGNYAHPRFGYTVGADVVSDDDWILENFARDQTRRPTTPLRGSGYEYAIGADMDEDGVVETRATLPYWDLRFRHRRDAGEMWVSTLPLSSRLAETELRVLARRYVEAVSGTGISLVQFGGELAIHERRYATRVLSERDVRVDGFDAFEVVFEVANVDQLQLDTSARWQRARVVIVRPGFYWRPDMYPANKPEFLPVVMTIGYVNHPEDFIANEPHFDRLVNGLSISDPNLDDRAAAMLACAPEAQRVSFLMTRTNVSWSIRVIDPRPESDAQRSCIVGHIRGFERPDNGLRAVSRTVARPRPPLEAPAPAATPVAETPVEAAPPVIPAAPAP